MTHLFPRELQADCNVQLPPLDQALFDAVIANDPAALRARLDAGTPPDHPAGDLTRMTPLMYAILGGHHECMRMLLEAGADVHLIDGQKGRSPLRAALHMKDETAVKLLLDFGTDPGFKSVGYWPTGERHEYITDEDIALRWAPELAPMVTAARAKFKVIELAHDNGDPAEVRRLLDGGVDPDIKNYNGQTALMYACLHRNIDMVKTLLEFGADPNIQWHNGGATALRLACGGHGKQPANPAIMELLLAHGADPHIRDNRGRSLMHTAATSGNEKIMQIAAKQGVPLNERDAEGNTPLYAAQEWGNKEEAAPLLEQVAAWNSDEIGRGATTLGQPIKPMKALKFGPKV